MLDRLGLGAFKNGFKHGTLLCDRRDLLEIALAHAISISCTRALPLAVRELILPFATSLD